MSKSRESARKSNEDNSFLLKGKVKDLEAEVTKLKQRLEDLRKAKNSTIVKREREVVQVEQPNLGRSAGVETYKYKELERKLAESELRNKNSVRECQELQDRVKAIEEENVKLAKDRDMWKSKFEQGERDFGLVRETHAAEMERIKAECREKSAAADDANTELERLRERLEMKAMQEENKHKENHDREGFINGLMSENADLRTKIESLYNELSVKEAKWLEASDRMNQDLREKWDTKYAAWMTETERRIIELKEANLLLKSALSKGGPKPTEGNEALD
uniref:uncharacterized protein LOC104266094 n=1 Tax=Ciona intestinalis TaxID=7719 RepID=UPI000521C778|nr:uncharacterized protein LOC104266094 [Ciona intestinalis]|eukprot:XP_009859869.1 uncharacterized protein LOC104266094 [Ciona intestinalis]